MAKITIVTYAHAAHRQWIPHWAQQINNQSTQDFKVLFIAHNWGTGSPSQEQANREDFFSRLGEFRQIDFVSYWSEPVIGRVINHACRLVDTEYLAHWDIDDIFHPERITLQTAFLNQHSNIDFLNARCVGFNGLEPDFDDQWYHDKSSPLLEYLTDPNLNSNDKIKECFGKGYNCLSHGLMVYRPRDIQNIGGFSLSDVKTDGKSPDWETWKKAINSGYQFYRMSELLMYWRLDSSSIRN